MLYSFNRQEAGPLPYRIRLPDGSSRTDPSSFTEEEISLAGYIPVAQTKPVMTDDNKVYWSSDDLVWIVKSKPIIDVETQVVEWNGTEWIVRDFTEQELQLREDAKWNAANLNRIQFEFMIEKLNLGPIIEAAIAALPEDTDEEKNAKIMARVLYRSGQDFHRKHPLFAQLAPAVGLTDEQLDTIWLEAKAI